jgi:hypothetical protein
MLTCWIDDTIEQDDRVLSRILGDSEALPEHGEQERPDVLMCRAMWEALGCERLHVVIPYAKRIRFQTQTNRRNPEMLLGLVKAHALLYSLQRERQEIKGVPVIMATREDFDSAARLYTLLNGSSGGQTTKLTKMESDLLGTITSLNWVEFTIPVLQKATGLSNAVIHRLIHGYTSRGASYSGLLEKCPAIAYTDRTVVSEDEQNGYSTRRRTNAYTFDRELFRKWMAGGAVWLEDEPGPDHDKPTESRQSPSTTTEDSVRLENEDSATDSLVPNKNTLLNVHNSESHSNSNLTRDSASADASACTYVCDPEISVRQESKNEQGTQNDKQPDQQPPITSRKHLQHAVGQDNSSVGLSIHPATINPTERRTILTTDYKKLDYPESRAICYSCGRRGAWYVEKLTPGRKGRPKDQQGARRICKACFNAAVQKKRIESPPLPGTISLASMQRITNSIGRCSVCDLAPAVYLDRDTDVRLCESCYAREGLQQTHDSFRASIDSVGGGM